jgi:acetylglutamate kinase
LEQQEILAEALAKALPRIEALAGKSIVVKVGGSTLGSHDTALEDVVTLGRLGVKVTLVHGGGSAISSWLQKIGKEARFVDGLRVTDAEAMEVVTMVLAGKVNKEMVSTLARLGGRALGISGLDDGLMRARRISDELGLVGEVTEINTALLDSILGLGIIPVVAPIGVGDAGESLNINADTAASAVAAALKAEQIIFLTDIVGICDGDKNLLPRLTERQALDLIESGVITGGMIPKARACLRALEGAGGARIIDGRQSHALLREVLTDQGIGTTIIR